MRKLALKQMGIIVLFILLFPYVLTLLTCGLHSRETITYNTLSESRYLVVFDTEIGSVQLSLEEYLIGAMAACIDPTYELEALSAQAIILRTNLLERLEGDVIKMNHYEASYFDIETRRNLWGNDFDTYESNFTLAVRNTTNMVIQVNERCVPIPYHAVSAGMTRDTSDVFENGEYEYCKSVACEHDIMAPNYQQVVQVKMEELGNLFGQALLEESQEILVRILEEDQTGYRLQMQVGKKRITGEEFRMLLGLASANFSIQANEEGMVIRTKGVGHGIGMSQYAANEMALAGSDFMQILSYFYQDIKIVLCA